MKLISRVQSHLLLGTALSFGTLSAGVARADVTWEHTGSVTIGTAKPQTVVTFNSRNVWSGQRQSMTLSYDATAAMGAADKMAPGVADSPAGALAAGAAKGSFTAICRYDDDRTIWIAPALKQYMDEPISTLPKRLRLNFWGTIDPELAKQDPPPQLTREQRIRLGHEIRAIVAPVTKKVTRFYFRALPDTKTINGMNAHGFRFTAMLNTSDKNGQDWMKCVAEWWLADAQPGDDEIKAFSQTAMKQHEAAGGPTASMWLNELPQVMLATMPDEMQQAMESMIGQYGTPAYGFQGTPLLMTMTVSPPPTDRLATGDIVMKVELKSRSTDTVPPAVFDPPAAYKKADLEPLLKLAANAMKEVQDAFQKGVDK